MINREKLSLSYIDQQLKEIIELKDEFKIIAQIYTVDNLRTDDKLRHIESIMDSSPIVSVNRIDVRDPLRYKTDKFDGALVKFLHENEDEHSIYIMTNNRKRYCRPSFWLYKDEEYVLYNGYGEIVLKSSIHVSEISLHLEKNELKQEELEECKKLFLDLAQYIKAFYGKVRDLSVDAHLCMLLEAAEMKDGKRRDATVQTGIRDIYWLNYFGPGYVNFWGEEKTQKLLEHYSSSEVFENGAVCIQTTPEPVKADLNIKRVVDYPWKKKFYEVLGYNTFVHEDFIRGEPGQYVPTLKYHKKMLEES